MSSENKDIENFDNNNDNIMEESLEKSEKNLGPVLANLISNPVNLYPFLFQSNNNITPNSKGSKNVASPSANNNNNFFSDDFQKDEIEEVFIIF